MGLSTDTEASGEAEVAAVQEAVAAAPAAVAEDTGGDVGRQLAAICRTLRSRDQEDASPYLILRSFAWAPVMYRAPMLDRDSIVPPESDLRVKLSASRRIPSGTRSSNSPKPTCCGLVPSTGSICSVTP